MRRAAKVDENHATIRDALRAAGAWVWSTASQGNGFPDLLVWHRATGFQLLEVKREGPPSKSRLTPAESSFIRGCPGPVYVVRTVEEAVATLRGPQLTALGQRMDAAQAIANWEADRASRNGGGA